MATTATTSIIQGGHGKVVAWTLANGETGDYVEETNWADRSVQVSGTFGSGGSVTIEGSNDGTNWATLSDYQGNGIIVTSAKIKGVAEITRYIRPVVTAGDGTTSITITIMVRGVV